MSITRRFTYEDIQEIKQAVAMEHSYYSRISTVLAIKLFLSDTPSNAVKTEIEAMEGSTHRISRTKPPTQLQNAALHPLWHKHYYFAGRDLSFNANKRWLNGKKLTKLINKHSSGGRKAISLDALLNELIKEAHSDPKRPPSGEWIIFAKYAGKNYYLDVANHQDAKTEIKELELLEQIRNSCEWEFPNIFQSCHARPATSWESNH